MLWNHRSNRGKCATSLENRTKGGYAEKVDAPTEFLLPLPDCFDDLEDAAGLTYASCAIWLILSKMHARHTLFPHKWILIREGSDIAPPHWQYNMQNTWA